MDYSEEESEEDFFKDIRKSRKVAKEKILDETFKKAEIKKGLRPKPGTEFLKKPFLKIGVILIVISIICLVAISYFPWLYIKYDDPQFGTIQEMLYESDFKRGDYYKEIDLIFESPCTNCSGDSNNFLGITKNDFLGGFRTTATGYYLLAILGVIFTVFEIVRRKREMPIEIVTIGHSLVAAISIIVSILITSIFIKFLGSYFLLYYNKSFIETSGVSNIILIYFVPLLIIILSLATVIVSVIVLKVNFKEFQKKISSGSSRFSYSDHDSGSML